MIPVNINCQGPPLTPLKRAWAFGEAMRAAADAVPERIAMIGTGGISHWPATPDSGKINEAWDREFLDRWVRNDRDALLAYDDATIYAEPGRAASRSAHSSPSQRGRAAPGTVHFYAPIPIFAVGCTIATYQIAA